VSSWQSNGHSCFAQLSGIPVGQGWDFAGENNCTLQLRIDRDGTIDIKDPNWACKSYYCGMRAVLEGLAFPRSSQVDCAALEGDW
jgi:hypothetical protein